MTTESPIPATRTSDSYDIVKWLGLPPPRPNGASGSAPQPETRLFGSGPQPRPRPQSGQTNGSGPLGGWRTDVELDVFPRAEHPERAEPQDYTRSVIDR